jgi:hypothetical protein
VGKLNLDRVVLETVINKMGRNTDKVYLRNSHPWEFLNHGSGYVGDQCMAVKMRIRRS